jgi:hypothetical protein
MAATLSQTSEKSLPQRAERLQRNGCIWQGKQLDRFCRLKKREKWSERIDRKKSGTGVPDTRVVLQNASALRLTQYYGFFFAIRRYQNPDAMKRTAAPKQNQIKNGDGK